MKIKILILTLPLLLGSCATLGKKFKPNTVADVGFFTDNTIAIIQEANFGYAKRISLYTKEYFHYDEAEEKRFKENQQKMEKVLKHIVKYSLNLVTVVETEEKTSARIKKYADYMEKFDDAVLAALGLERDHFEEILDEIRQQKKLLDALRKAQPIINAMGRYVEVQLDDMEEAVIILISKIDKAIDEEFADVIRYQETLEDEKYATLAGLEKLYFTWKGDKAAYKEFLKSDVIRNRNVTPKAHPTTPQVVKLVDYLTARLDRLHRIQEKIHDDWDLYRKTHKELDQILAQVMAEIRQIRVITLVWIRAHQKMASGRTDPAEWFNMNEAPVHLMNMGRKLVF